MNLTAGFVDFPFHRQTGVISSPQVTMSGISYSDLEEESTGLFPGQLTRSDNATKVSELIHCLKRFIIHNEVRG